MLIHDNPESSSLPIATASAVAASAAVPAKQVREDDGERAAQIDGLRAIAMLGVLYVHFWDDRPLTEHLRVSLFFVVSGFLITYIHDRARQKGGTINVLNFYVRRGLRLLPALLVFVIVALAFNA